MKYYTWDEFADHTWLASDMDENVAVFMCGVGFRLPTWICVPDNLVPQDLEQQLVQTLPEIENVGSFRKFRKKLADPGRKEFVQWLYAMVSRGLCVLDFPSTSDGSAQYYDYSTPIPTRLLKSHELPPSLYELTRYFRLTTKRFSEQDAVRFDDFKDENKEGLSDAGEQGEFRDTPQNTNPYL